MTKVILNIPESINSSAFDLPTYVASKLYADGLITAGQGAEIAGISKRTFIELLGKYGVSVFSESVDDLRNDIDNA
ncbi:MAG: UPF0175 family protein [Flavobacteriales bacterium]|jgi:predicted HTH domain antitoxin